MPTSSDSELQRAAVAREEFIDWACRWWPPRYKAFVPVSCDGRLLIQAKGQIERMMSQDSQTIVAQREHPRIEMGPMPTMIDWSQVSPLQRMEMGLWESWPGGVAAYERVQMAQKTAETATELYVAAANGDVPGQTPESVAALKADADKTYAAWTAAQAEFEKQRK